MPSVSDPRLLPLASIFARIDPAREAIVHEDIRWTFGDLDRRSAQLAGWLAGQDVVADDLVAFALPNGPDFLALTFAIYRCGATPAPLSPKLAPAERDAILAVMAPRCFMTATDLSAPQEQLLTAACNVHIAASWKACTSGGSTGQPKVIVDKRPAGFAAGTDFIAIPADNRVLVPGPLYHNAPFSAAVFALWRGNTVVTMPRFGAEKALDLIAVEKAAWTIMVPTMMHRIMALPEEARDPARFPRWSCVVHTAAPMARWLKNRWIAWFGAAHICEVYGATEGLVRCWITGGEWLERPGSVGRPLGEAQLKILNPEGDEVAAGEQGEIYAMPPGGAQSSYRYLGAKRRATADGWESVGDIGWVDAQGYLFLADRMDDLIITGGINVWPAEVEAALLEHPAIRSCAVYGVAHRDLDMAVHAVIEAEGAFDLDEVSDFLGDRLTKAKHPRTFELVTEPVRDDAGKFRKPRQASKDTT